MSLPREAKTQAEIVRSLHLHPNTVHTYLRMPTFVAHYCHPHPTPVEPYRTYLEERGQQGEIMITTRLPRGTRARFYRQRYQCLDVRAQLAASLRDDSYVFIFLWGSLDSSGRSCHSNAESS